MATWQTYSKTIFGLPDNAFEGVEQGFDPCAEPRGRVQDVLNNEFHNGQIKKRKGYAKYHHLHNTSILTLADLELMEDSGLTFNTGDGDLRMITNMPSAVTSVVDLTKFDENSSSSSSFGFSSSSSSSSSSSMGNTSESSSSSSSLKITSSSTSNAGTWQVAFSTTLPYVDGGGGYAGKAHRQIIPLSVTGSKIRLTVMGALIGYVPFQGTQTIHVSIVPRSADSNGTTTPTEITFNSGSSGFSIGNGEILLSDEITFSTTAGSEYLITYDYPVGLTGIQFIDGGPLPTSYLKTGEYWDQQDMASPTLSRDIYTTLQVEVYG